MLLPFSETSTKVALPSVKLVYETFLSQSDDRDSTLLDRLFLLFPMIKTALFVKIFELQRNLGELKLY